MRLEDLPPKMRQRVIASLSKDEQRRAVKQPRSRATADSAMLLRCCTADCTFPPTSSADAMDKHCDVAHHHRYENVLT